MRSLKATDKDVDNRKNRSGVWSAAYEEQCVAETFRVESPVATDPSLRLSDGG